jgi:hypothetical protein
MAATDGAVSGVSPCSHPYRHHPAGFPKGVLVNYTSRAKQLHSHGMGSWGLLLTGSSGVIRVMLSIPQVSKNQQRDQNCPAVVVVT